MNEQVAQSVKILRKQAQDNLILADWLESMKIYDPVKTPMSETPPAQEETPKE